MAEQTPKQVDPEEYRGGVPEPDQAKGGTAGLAKEGMVPDQAQDDAQPPDSSDPQAMDSDAMGDFPEPNAEDDIDLSAGDEADATSQGASGGARGSDAGLGRHDPSTVDEDH